MSRRPGAAGGSDLMSDEISSSAESTVDAVYRPDVIEAKWQARWAERGTNEPDLTAPSGRSTT